MFDKKQWRRDWAKRNRSKVLASNQKYNEKRKDKKGNYILKYSGPIESIKRRTKNVMER